MALPTSTGVVLEMMMMGKLSAAHLRELLTAASPPMTAERGQALTADILRCCDRVIAAISRGATTGRKRKAVDGGAATCPDDLPLLPSKRSRARGAKAHRVVEADTAADGFVWRKYGQKDINGSNHPRFYYRCLYSGEGCGATRRVQQSRDQPAAFTISYYGEHTCRGGAGAGVGVSCQQGERAGMTPPAVVDYSASNAWGGLGVDANPLMPLLHANHTRHSHGDAPGETSQERGSSPSSSSFSGSSEAELASSTLLEFLDGSFGDGWESVVNYLAFDFDGHLPQVAMLQ